MKFPPLRLFFMLVLLASVRAAEPNFDDALKRAALDYASRLERANEELNQTRGRVLQEKTPLLDELRATEDRIIALEREITRLTTGQEGAAGNKRRLLRDIEETRKTGAYVATLAGDALKALSDGLLPGEDARVGERVGELTKRLEAAAVAGASGPTSVDVAEFLLERTERALGGELIAGSAMNATDHLVHAGTFAFAGPEVFFRPASGAAAGIVRLREGARQPTYYPQREWTGAGSEAFFSGQLGSAPMDSSGGKALRLQQTTATWREHVEKGGKVAYAIVIVGLVALGLIVHKLFDVAAMRVDTSKRVPSFLRAVSQGSRREAEEALPGLQRCTREIFAEGLKNFDAPGPILEERVEAILLGQRLHFERRLPLLAVIATAAPLMGLLGTVVGMVKTFTLITVFGTGNAAKLSSGISEVLVATELGLAVAIPALVVHGFLAHRINKKMAQLERQALQFVTAAATAQSGLAPAPEEVVR